MKCIYIAGPFRASTPWGIEENVRRAERYSLRMWQLGIVPICPHTQTRFFQGSANDETFLEGTLEIMRRCDAVFLVPGWERSTGTRGEIAEARMLGLPVFDVMIDLKRWAGVL